MQIQPTTPVFKALRWMGLQRRPRLAVHLVAEEIIEEAARRAVLREIERGNPPPPGTAMLLDKTFTGKLPDAIGGKFP